MNIIKLISENLLDQVYDPNYLNRVRVFHKDNQLSPEVTQAGLSDVHKWVREEASSHPDISAEQISMALNDPFEKVRVNAMKHPMLQLNISPKL